MKYSRGAIMRGFFVSLVILSSFIFEAASANTMASRIQAYLKKYYKIHANIVHYPEGSKRVPSRIAKRVYGLDGNVRESLGQSDLMLGIHHRIDQLRGAPAILKDGIAGAYVKERMDILRFAKRVDGIPDMVAVGVVDDYNIDFLYGFTELLPQKLSVVMKRAGEPYQFRENLEFFFQRYWDEQIVVGGLTPDDFFFVNSSHYGRVLTALPTMGDVVIAGSGSLSLDWRNSALKTIDSSRRILNYVGYKGATNHPTIINNIERAIQGMKVD